MVKLNLKKTLIATEEVLFLKNFTKAIKHMSIFMLESILSDDITINDQSKWEFLAYIRDWFNFLKNEGNDQLTLKREVCMICFAGCEIHFFGGNKMGSGIGFYFEYKDGILKDLTICNASTGSQKALEDKNHIYKLHGRYDLLLPKNSNR